MAGLTAIKRTGYLHGGVTHPDGRRGFFKGAQADTSKNEPMSPGTSVGGNTRGGTGKGRQDAESQYGADSYGSYDSTTNKSPRGSDTNIIIPKKKPPKTKDNYKTNFVKDFFNYSIPTNIMKNIAKSKFVTNLNAKKREKYINDLLETDPEEYNRIMGDLSKINMIVGPQVIGSTQIGPQVKTDYGMPKAPPSMLTSNFEVIDGRKSLGDPSALEILGQKYKDTLTFDYNGGGNGNDPPTSPAQGTNGGNGSGPGTPQGSGGGGGATAVGGTWPSQGGGAGATTSISSSPLSFGGGGGGGSEGIAGGAGSPCGTGGASNPVSGGVGTAGGTNTGGGGGSGGRGSPGAGDINGGAGGSGIVYIRYKFQ